MKKNNIFSFALIAIVSISILFGSCKKEILTKEPESFYDKGERLKLSNNLVILNENELTHSGGQAGFLYDESTQILQMDESAVEMELDTTVVLHIDTNDGVLVRRVTGVEKMNGMYTLQTSQGYITDVFNNANLNFDFSPEYSNEQLKSQSLSTMTNEELSLVLTDDYNGVHPSEIRMIIGDTEKILFSVDKNISLPATKSATSNKTGFEHQFNTNKTIVSVGPVDLVLEDFGFSWYSNLKAKFSKDIGLTSGHASFEVTAEDMDIEAWFDAALVADGEIPLVNETDPLLLPVVIRFEFPVGAVPVLIGVEFALDLGTEISVEGEAKVSSGYTVKYNVPKVMVGGHYSYWTNWHGVHHSSGSNYDYKKGHIVDQHFHPLKLEAMATLKQVYTLKPTMGFSIYNVAGPEINLAIGTEFDFEVGAGASFSLEDAEAPETYIGWGGKLSTKVGAGGGAWIDVFGVVNKHWDIPTLPILPSVPIWHTPESMENKTGNDFTHTIVGQSKKVEVEVKDNWTLPAPMMFVTWVSDGGGHWEHPITMTALGTTTNTWIPTEPGTHKPYCYVKNGKLKEVGKVTFTTTTTE